MLENKMKRNNLILVLSFIALILVLPRLLDYADLTFDGSNTTLVELLLVTISSSLMVFFSIYKKIGIKYYSIPLVLILFVDIYRKFEMVRGLNKYSYLFYLIYYLVTIILSLIAILKDDKFIKVSVLFLIGSIALFVCPTVTLEDILKNILDLNCLFISKSLIVAALAIIINFKKEWELNE